MIRQQHGATGSVAVVLLQDNMISLKTPETAFKTSGIEPSCALNDDSAQIQRLQRRFSRLLLHIAHLLLRRIAGRCDCTGTRGDGETAV
ncbi:hypothetical protein DXT99_25130 [Pontibacter diazotrophicus]|uniref:Uncharacterized protein n=1 Tax=Pontibacter diazotrophicus TaxID=1400979 RepID=A0A3D8L1L9_9BACT|nr:hypothetical protein DXT99_25130 [Pontibacter diazotrophicus]